MKFSVGNRGVGSSLGICIVTSSPALELRVLFLTFLPTSCCLPDRVLTLESVPLSDVSFRSFHMFRRLSRRTFPRHHVTVPVPESLSAPMDAPRQLFEFVRTSVFETDAPILTP